MPRDPYMQFCSQMLALGLTLTGFKVVSSAEVNFDIPGLETQGVRYEAKDRWFGDFLGESGSATQERAPKILGQPRFVRVPFHNHQGQFLYHKIMPESEYRQLALRAPSYGTP